MVKIIKWKELNQYKSCWQSRKTVLVGGCFDLFHFGHLTFLKNAKKAGDFLIIALESDEFIRKKKKRQPIHNQLQRAEILALLSLVDLVMLLPYFSSDEDYFNLVREVRPKVIAVSEGDSQLINKKRQAKEIGASVKVVTPLIESFSSSEILSKILNYF